jgi:hypothetical protein
MSRLRLPGYLLAALLCLQPIIEVSTSAWPPHLGVYGWRFGYLASLSSAFLIPLLGLVLAYLIALQVGDRGVAMAVGALGVLAALCCVAAAGVFALDALQMRVQVRADQVSRFNVNAAWAAAKLVIAALASLVLGVSAIRAGGAMRVEERVSRPKAGPLIVARPLEAARPAEIESSVGSVGSE